MRSVRKRSLAFVRSREEPASGIVQVLGGEVCLLHRFGLGCAVAGFYVDGCCNAGIFACENVAEHVADHHAAGQVEIVFSGGTQQHARAGFAVGMIDAAAAVGGGVGIGWRRNRAEVSRVQFCTSGGELVINLGLHGVHVGFREFAATHAGLIADDDARVASGGKQFDGIGGAGENLDLIRARDVVDLADDGAVAVEEGGWVHGGSLASVRWVQIRLPKGIKLAHHPLDGVVRPRSERGGGRRRWV